MSVPTMSQIHTTGATRKKGGTTALHQKMSRTRTSHAEPITRVTLMAMTTPGAGQPHAGTTAV